MAFFPIQRRQCDSRSLVVTGGWHSLERPNQFVVSGEAVLGILRQEAEKYLRDGGRNVRTEISDIGRGQTGVAGQFVCDVAARKRGHTGQEVIEGTAQGVHIAQDAGRSAVARLLGRHVIHRADRRPLTSDALILELRLEGQPQVDDLRLATECPKDVRWLDVSMDQAPGRCIAKSAGHAANYTDCLGYPQWTIALDIFVEVAALDILQDQVMPPLVDPPVENCDDTGMLQSLGAARLAQKPLE